MRTSARHNALSVVGAESMVVRTARPRGSFRESEMERFPLVEHVRKSFSWWSRTGVPAENVGARLDASGVNSDDVRAKVRQNHWGAPC